MAQDYTFQPSPVRNAGAINTSVPSYEEGEWTPAITCATPGDLSVAYDYQFGRYLIIGNKIFVEGAIAPSTFTHTTASGEVRITGLPSKVMTNSNSFRVPVGSLGFQGITKANYTQFAPAINSQETFLTITCSGSAQNSVSLGITDIPTGGTVWLLFSIWYSSI